MMLTIAQFMSGIESLILGGFARTTITLRNTFEAFYPSSHNSSNSTHLTQYIRHSISQDYQMRIISLGQDPSTSLIIVGQSFLL